MMIQVVIPDGAAVGIAELVLDWAVTPAMAKPRTKRAPVKIILLDA